MRTSENIIEVEVYWDTSGDIEGFSERVTYNDGHQESGPCSLVDDHDDIASAVVGVAFSYGLSIDDGSVGVSDRDGGHGVWTRA